MVDPLVTSPPAQRLNRPPVVLEPPYPFRWSVVWALWLWSGLWASWAVASGLAHWLFLLVLTLALLGRWGADGLRGFGAPDAGDAGRPADPGAGRGLRHPHLLPLVLTCLVVLVWTHALLLARIKLFEPALLQVAARTAEADSRPSAESHWLTDPVFGGATAFHDQDEKLLGTEFCADDGVMFDHYNLLLAADDTTLNQGERIGRHTFFHLFGRWWTCRVKF